MRSAGTSATPTTGLFPVRADADPALLLALYTKTVVVRQALSEGVNVAVTSSSRSQLPHWRDIAESFAAHFAVTTIDPGRQVVEARLSDAKTGRLSDSCATAIGRWYG